MYEELEHVFDKFPKYHMQILLVFYATRVKMDSGSPFWVTASRIGTDCDLYGTRWLLS
jgi:hypothetical protein